MPVNLTLKSLPDEIYQQLKIAAAMHHRSLNSELIACLESLFLPVKKTPQQRVAEIRALTAGIHVPFTSEIELNDLKNMGRP